MTWLARWWRRFWFTPTLPVDLGVTRFLFFGFLLYYFRFQRFGLWADVPDVFWMPVSFFATLGVEPLSAAGLELLTVVWLISLGLSCVGLLTRPSVFIAFCSSLYLLGLPHNFGKVHHSDALLILLMGAFAVSRCGDAFSVDSLIRRVRGHASIRSASPEYRWPLQLARVIFCLTFFAAGVAKLRLSGLEWILSDNMALNLVRHHYTHNPPIDLGLALAEIAWIPPLIAAMTIVFELGAPLALFNRTARWFLIPGLFLMQCGIWILLGVSFRQMFPAYLVWIPYRELGEAARIRLGLAIRADPDRSSAGT